MERSENKSENRHHFRIEAKLSKMEAKNCHHFRFEAK
jgi:hypothetical protein